MGSSQTSCFLWQLGCLHLLWEEERWVPFVFCGHISILWWPDSALLHAFLHHGALVFLILHISWKFTDLRDSKKHTVCLVPSYPGASTKTKRHVFSGTMESLVPALKGLLVDWTALRWEGKRGQVKESGGKGEGRKEGRQGGRDLSMKELSFFLRMCSAFLEVVLNVVIEMILVVDDLCFGFLFVFL